MVEISFLYQDDDIAVIEKPGNLVVNRADTVKEPTLQEWWEDQLSQVKSTEVDWKKMVPEDFPHEFGSPKETFMGRGGIVHRLDKETSGVMVLAKNPGSLANLLRQFRVREVEKQYICLVHGKFQVKEDTLSLPLGRSVQNRTRFTVVPDGRGAETKYRVEETYTGFKDLAFLPSGNNLRKKFQNTYQGFSLVRCWPKTGRTHQIRVHMNHVKHPIVADETYLGSKRYSLDLNWCPRLFLHAEHLSFNHPRTGKRLEFISELPAELHTALAHLEKIA